MTHEDAPVEARADGLTHLDRTGTAQMVDVSAKPATIRTAVATGRIDMAAATRDAIRDAAIAKGDVLAVARIAGIMAAKATASLIPLCHPLPLDRVAIDLAIDDGGVVVTATATTTGRTGVEMEALTAATVSLLTIYDMAKALDRSMTISGVRLLAKHGGRSGAWMADRAKA